MKITQSFRTPLGNGFVAKQMGGVRNLSGNTTIVYTLPIYQMVKIISCTGFIGVAFGMNRTHFSECGKCYYFWRSV